MIKGAFQNKEIGCKNPSDHRDFSTRAIRDKGQRSSCTPRSCCSQLCSSTLTHTLELKHAAEQVVPLKMPAVRKLPGLGIHRSVHVLSSSAATYAEFTYHQRAHYLLVQVTWSYIDAVLYIAVLLYQMSLLQWSLKTIHI